MKKSSRLIQDHELSLYSLEHQYSISSALYENEEQRETLATFDLLVRDRPPKRNFLVAGGLEAILNFLSEMTFTDEQVQYLLDAKRISENFAEYMRSFSFSGNIEAMPEGTVHFPGEPMLRVTAPLIEANLITDQLMALATVDTLMLSKIARVKLAGGSGRTSIGFVRAHGIDAGWRACRNAMLFPNASISNSAASLRMGLQGEPTIVAPHAFIKSYPTELDAMREAARMFPNGMSPMVDTYDVKQGIENAIIVADEMKERDQQLGGITLDSGDLLEGARMARKMLDEAGHEKVRIAVTGSLDEYEIEKLVAKKIPADVFLVVTYVVTSADSPILETVYKLCETKYKDQCRPAAKLAEGKVSLPGRKQIFRVRSKDGQIKEDTIGHENEDLPGEQLLVPWMKDGKIIQEIPSVEETREYIGKQLESIPTKLQSLTKEAELPLQISDSVQNMLEMIRKKHVK